MASRAADSTTILHSFSSSSSSSSSSSASSSSSSSMYYSLESSSVQHPDSVSDDEIQPCRSRKRSIPFRKVETVTPTRSLSKPMTCVSCKCKYSAPTMNSETLCSIECGMGYAYSHKETDPNKFRNMFELFHTLGNGNVIPGILRTNEMTDRGYWSRMMNLYKKNETRKRYIEENVLKLLIEQV